MEIFIGTIIGFVVAAVLLFIFKRRIGGDLENTSEEISQSVENEIRKIMPEMLKDGTERLITMADQKLGAEKKEMKTDMEGKRSEISRMVKLIREDLKTGQNDLKKAEKERVGSFESLRTSLEVHKKITEQLSASTENLKSVLSNNQLRGQFGEQVAEELLKMSGFVKGVDFVHNVSMEHTDTRPDFTIYFPDKTKVNVDAKFPYSNLQKYTETDNQEERKSYLNQFKRDVKEKIKQVTSRDYINPDDNTVDFVIMFIPNEMIYSFVYDKMNDIWTEAFQKKVIMAGPFSLTAILRMIRQAYDNFKYQGNLREIIQHVHAFEKEFGKWNEEFSKIGVRIDSLQRQYNTVSSTRTNALVRQIDRIRLVEFPESEVKDKPKLIESK